MGQQLQSTNSSKTLEHFLKAIDFTVAELASSNAES